MGHNILSNLDTWPKEASKCCSLSCCKNGECTKTGLITNCIAPAFSPNRTSSDTASSSRNWRKRKQETVQISASPNPVPPRPSTLQKPPEISTANFVHGTRIFHSKLCDIGPVFSCFPFFFETTPMAGVLSHVVSAPFTHATMHSFNDNAAHDFQMVGCPNVWILFLSKETITRELTGGHGHYLSNVCTWTQKWNFHWWTVTKYARFSVLTFADTSERERERESLQFPLSVSASNHGKSRIRMQAKHGIEWTHQALFFRQDNREPVLPKGQHLLKWHKRWTREDFPKRQINFPHFTHGVPPQKQKSCVWQNGKSLNTQNCLYLVPASMHSFPDIFGCQKKRSGAGPPMISGYTRPLVYPPHTHTYNSFSPPPQMCHPLWCLTPPRLCFSKPEHLTDPLLESLVPKCGTNNKESKCHARHPEINGFLLRTIRLHFRKRCSLLLDRKHADIWTQSRKANKQIRSWKIEHKQQSLIFDGHMCTQRIRLKQVIKSRPNRMVKVPSYLISFCFARLIHGYFFNDKKLDVCILSAGDV